jgi:hypothetical protein
MVNRRRIGVEFLPVFPLWPGFALNTLFYATIAWVLWRIPILIRRHRRRARNLCVKCAYDRAGLGTGVACPECGHSSASSA